MENGELFAERVISDEDEIDCECIAHPLLEDVASDSEEESFSSSSSSEEYISRNGFFITVENATERRKLVPAISMIILIINSCMKIVK